MAGRSVKVLVAACGAWLLLVCSAPGSASAQVATCDDAPLPASFEADGSGARAALPGQSFDACSAIDLDGDPP